MREIDWSDVAAELAALLDAAEQGQEITIIRRGRAVARLVPADAVGEPVRAKAAVARMRHVRQGLTLGEDTTLKGLIDEGRK